MAGREKRPPPPTADEVRRTLIQWFYDLNKRGRAARGMKELCKGIKDDYAFKAPLVKQHLTYLVDLVTLLDSSDTGLRWFSDRDRFGSFGGVKGGG